MYVGGEVLTLDSCCVLVGSPFEACSLGVSRVNILPLLAYVTVEVLVGVREPTFNRCCVLPSSYFAYCRRPSICRWVVLYPVSLAPVVDQV